MDGRKEEVSGDIGLLAMGGTWLESPNNVIIKRDGMKANGTDRGCFARHHFAEPLGSNVLPISIQSLTHQVA